MSYHIDVENQQRSIPITNAFILKMARKILTLMGVKHASLSVIVVTNRTIHSINRKFLRHDYPTDVIAFDLTESELSRSKKKVQQVDGEIYISAVMAKLNAKRFETDLKQELVLYLVHGILHLLGYDDHGAQTKKRMRAKEKEILHFLSRES